MTDFLPFLVIFMVLVVALGAFNDRVTKLTYEIALMMFSIIVGGILLIVSINLGDGNVKATIDQVLTFDLDDFLMKGVLCFMLFAGSCHMRFKDFERFWRQISVLSIVATFLGAVFYGALFFLVSSLLGLGFTFPMCLMFGSIVAPTDPIAATSILKKFNLPKHISFLIEGESLLNDGVGVALFVCFSGMVKASGAHQSILLVMLREIVGAVVVGALVSFLFFLIFYLTKDVHRRIFCSIAAVALAYYLCMIFDFSGAIASVVCGVLFSTLRQKAEHRGKEWDLEKYDSFWEIMDDLLNSVLYVALGLSFIRILAMPHVILISLLAIVCNLLARSGSLAVSTLILGPIPDGYDKPNFVKLLTWGGLRGGLCIALAISATDLMSPEAFRILLGATYAIVAFTTIVQGLTMPKVYRGITKSLAKKAAV